MNILERFSKCLEEITYPTQPEGWHISGIIRNKSNQVFKFDVRGMQESSGRLEKSGSTNTKANKMVFETEKEWLIIDIEELHQYIKDNRITLVRLEDLIYKLTWNIILPKNYVTKNTI